MGAGDDPVSGTRPAVPPGGGSGSHDTWQGPSPLTPSTSRRGWRSSAGRADHRDDILTRGRCSGPAGIYLHRVGEVEFLGRATELLPGLVLRHCGSAAESEGTRPGTAGGATQPTYHLLLTARDRCGGRSGPKMAAPPRTNASSHWTARPALAQWEGEMLQGGAEPRASGSGSAQGEVKSRETGATLPQCPLQVGGASRRCCPGGPSRETDARPESQDAAAGWEVLEMQPWSRQVPADTPAAYQSGVEGTETPGRHRKVCAMGIYVCSRDPIGSLCVRRLKPSVEGRSGCSAEGRGRRGPFQVSGVRSGRVFRGRGRGPIITCAGVRNFNLALQALR